MAVEHVNIVEAELHEPKGVSLAGVDEVYVTDGAGSGDHKSVANVYREGFYVYEHSGGAETLTGSNTWDTVENNDNGSDTTDTYGLSDVSQLWDDATNRFDFSELSLGDVVTIGLEIEVDINSANSLIELQIQMDTGGAKETDFTLYAMEAGSSTRSFPIYTSVTIPMWHQDWIDNPALLQIRSSLTTNTYTVERFFIGVRKKGLIT